MKLTIIGAACLAVLVGAYEVAANYHDGAILHTLAARAKSMHLPWTSQPDHLYHGVAVNTAVEDRKSPYWQEAYEQTSTHPGLIASARFKSPFPGRIIAGSHWLPEVALTFDDGPHPKTVARLVQELKDLNVKATFFEVGKMVEKHPELVKLEADAGNEIANHTFSHVNLSKIPEEEAAVEYRACNLLLEGIVKHPIRFCRPPGGRSDPDVFRAAAVEGLSTVLWTDDPLDYSNPGEQEIFDRTMKCLGNGGIILLHEGVDQTMDILPKLVAEIRSQGYRIVTVGQLVEDTHRQLNRMRSIARRMTHAKLGGPSPALRA
jgi:peptidoglycan/xylan/chitin deacetylase (PgdA/CDA1 family)